MPKANLHYYFRTKDALYARVLDEILALWIDTAEAIRPEAEGAQRLVPPGRAVQPRDHLPQRHAQVAAAGQPAVRRAGGDPFGHPGADPVGQARAGVRLVDHDGDPAPPRGEVERGADVAADANQHVGPDMEIEIFMLEPPG